MKLKKSLYLQSSYLAKSCVAAFLAAALEVCVLLTAAFALWQDSGFGGGWRLAVLIGCLVGAVGVIWLSLSLYLLGREITSIAGRLKSDDRPDAPLSPKVRCGDIAVEKLLGAIDDRMQYNSSYVAELKAQIEELQIQLRVSQRQRSYLESIIYGIHDAVIVVDQFDKLLLANETAGRLFNFDHKASRYKPVVGLIDEGRRSFIELLKKTRKNRAKLARYDFETVQNGEQMFFDCVVSGICDENQQVSGIVAVLHDVTKERGIADMKNDFVSHVSHELKTPLASISAYAEMLVDGEADNDQTRKEFYSVIQSQAKRLNRLIEDILNISRIESGLIKVEKKPVSLAMVIQEQLQMIKSYAEEKNIKIVCPELIVFDQVYGDKDMLSQVVVNLLSNAVKYTPAGGTVTIATEVDESAGLARVSITDTGVGIPENKLGHLFEKFYRVEENGKMAKGTGLGLNLVKQVIEKVHNGRVFVKSKVGAGSTFGFELPLATAGVVEGSV